MPGSRGILPEGAPAELWEFFEAHPASTIDEAIAELKLHRATAYYALARLSDKGLIEVSNTTRPHRWKIRETQVQARAAETVAAALPALAITSPGRIRPTGMPYSVVEGRICPTAGGLQVFAVTGVQLRESNYSRQGSVNTPGEGHPWAHPLKAAG
jgi:hypothetical protein